MEENRRFSWSDLFIKVILVIIFILFTVWLLSLSNKKMTNSLEVLTDKIFVENMERMKEVGKEYFTTERLPEKVGEMEILTLEKMYEKKLLLELKDKNGNACSTENSYISIEKFDTEYQMKVYLECGKESDYIVVIMGCYDYCDTDICEKQEEPEEEYVKGEVEDIEYEYKKTTGGKWTDYGPWSEWSKVSVTKADYRQVETKKVNEEYSYDKTVTETLFEEVIATCPEGYKKTSDGTKCYKEITTTLYENPVCPVIEGLTLTGQDGFNCIYSTTTKLTENPVCPTVSEFTLTSQNGFTCTYSKPVTETASPNACPATSGDYTLTSQNGFTCNYSKTTTTITDPVCPVKSGWNVSRSGFTCNYSREVTTSYQVKVTNQKTCYSSKDIIPCTGCAPVTQRIPYDCSTTSYETRYSTTTETDTGTASCPTEYSKSGSTCVKSDATTMTKTVSCPTGFNKSGNKCVKSSSETTTKTASCPTGFNKSGSTCVKSITNTETKTASCPIEYSKSGNKCIKSIKNTDYETLYKSCSTGYTMTSDKTKCYQEIDKVVTMTETREVTYYRYRIREYIGGTVDYKWSTSKNDKKLLDAGYKLTGRTR